MNFAGRVVSEPHWIIVSDPGKPLDEYAEPICLTWVLANAAGETREIIVEISQSAYCSEPDTPPSPADEALATLGRSAIEAQCWSPHPPPDKFTISSTGITPLPG